MPRRDRPYGKMEWQLDTLPECQRLTRVLRELNPKLFCIYDRQVQKYAVMGPSQSQGYAIIQWLEDDKGRMVHPDVAPMLILDEIARMDRHWNIGKEAEAAAARMTREWQSQRETLGEYSKYVWEAAVAELEGHQRWGTADCFTGLRGAIEGRLRRPTGERGERYSLPGRAV